MRMYRAISRRHVRRRSRAGDRLASWTGGSYAHDAAGCVTRIERAGKPTLDLTWNGQYQLVSVSTNGAFAESYAYDALGRRVSTTTLEGTVRHVYDDSWQCLADIDEGGNVLCSYVWGDGIDKLLAVKIGGDAYYPLTDIQGTVWGYVDSANRIVARWTYDAWGNVLSEEVSVPALTSVRYRFQGRERSAVTGLINFRMRWYDAETGRWLSKDPIGLSGGLNLYAFCANAPIKLIDPLGQAHIGYCALKGESRGAQSFANMVKDIQLPGDRDPCHAEIFFDDGKSPANLGYSPRGVCPDDLDDAPPYTHMRNMFNDDIMRQAVDNVRDTGRWNGASYNLVFHNCQDFVSAVIAEYNRIVETPKRGLVSPVIFTR